MNLVEFEPLARLQRRLAQIASFHLADQPEKAVSETGVKAETRERSSTLRRSESDVDLVIVVQDQEDDAVSPDSIPTGTGSVNPRRQRQQRAPDRLIA